MNEMSLLKIRFGDNGQKLSKTINDGRPLILEISHSFTTLLYILKSVSFSFQKSPPPLRLLIFFGLLVHISTCNAFAEQICRRALCDTLYTH